AHELNGAARKKALTDFLSGKGWFRGSDVDRLSEEEAGIMAGRVMRKIRSVITFTDEKAKVLQDQSTEIFKRRLTGQLPDGSSPREEILKILRQHLSEKEVSVLEEALKDFRPNRDEP